MQTFLPFADFAKSAAALDDRRLRSQIQECAVILKACLAEPRSSCRDCLGNGWIQWTAGGWETVESCPKCHGKGTLPTPWFNHPIVVMWRGFEKHLSDYRMACCQELLWRGGESVWVDTVGRYDDPPPPWLSDERIHARYRANLLAKWGRLHRALGDKLGGVDGWPKTEPNPHRLYAKPLAPDSDASAPWSTGYELWEYRTGTKPARVD